jgi:hypothetical protein
VHACLYARAQVQGEIRSRRNGVSDNDLKEKCTRVATITSISFCK